MAYIKEDEVKQAALDRLTQEKKDQHKADMVAVLGTEEGRRVFADFFYKNKLMGDLHDHNGSKMNYLVGRHDVARDVYDDILKTAGFEAFVKLTQDDMENAKKDNLRFLALKKELEKK